MKIELSISDRWMKDIRTLLKRTQMAEVPAEDIVSRALSLYTTCLEEARDKKL
jgi:hypothetical protein